MSTTIVALENATVRNDNKLLFNKLNFKINSGDFVFLIGRTGAGKSSLLKILYGDLPLTEGEGNIVGYNLTQKHGSKIFRRT